MLHSHIWYWLLQKEFVGQELPRDRLPEWEWNTWNRSFDKKSVSLTPRLLVLQQPSKLSHSLLQMPVQSKMPCLRRFNFKYVFLSKEEKRSNRLNTIKIIIRFHWMVCVLHKTLQIWSHIRLMVVKNQKTQISLCFIKYSNSLFFFSMCRYQIACLTCRHSCSATSLLLYYHGDLHWQPYRSLSCSSFQHSCLGRSCWT